MYKCSIYFIIIYLILPINTTLGCSIFAYNHSNKFIVGKNYDWKFGHGLLTVNKRNVKKESLILDFFSGGHKLKSAKWVSKYGSVTFNQYGREFPVGGINEKGLMLEALVLPKTDIELKINVQTVNELQWVQYQLDNSVTVEDVISNIEKINIYPILENLHYFTCDATHACATIEFIDKQVIIHRTSYNLPYPTLTNHSYQESLDYFLNNRKGSLINFAILANSLSGQYNGNYIDDSFSILDLVFSTGEKYFTQWQIIYDLSSREVHFKVDHRLGVKKLSLDQLDFDCNTRVKIVKLNKPVYGDIFPYLTNYKTSMNKQIIQESFQGTGIPENILEFIYTYPSLTKCSNP